MTFFYYYSLVEYDEQREFSYFNTPNVDEIDQINTDIATIVSQRDQYRDIEFSFDQVSELFQNLRDKLVETSELVHYIKGFRLSKHQHVCIVGTLLGDAMIDKRERYTFSQSRIHHLYFAHVQYILSSIVWSSHYDLKRESYILSTVVHPMFKHLRKQWYPNGIKIVPEDMEITRLVLCYLLVFHKNLLIILIDFKSWMMWLLKKIQF